LKILLTGANGYVGKRLLPELVNRGYTVVCCVRDAARFHPPSCLLKRIEVIQVDFLKEETLREIPTDIEGAYYLMHSMSSSGDFVKNEQIVAENFRKQVSATHAKHVIYLGGISNHHSLSEHLKSRKNVEIELFKGSYDFTSLRAGIIVGSGSASYEIIRDLVEKLPIMIAPKWLATKCQPIGITDVIRYLSKTLFNTKTYHKSFDIGGPDVLTYKEMLLGYASVRKLKRKIYLFPIMTPKLSSYWLYFMTSTTYKLALALVDSMKIEVVCNNKEINEILGIEPICYQSALQRTLFRIEENQVISSWKDSLVSGGITQELSDFITVPTHGCFTDVRKRNFKKKQEVISRIWKIGGKNGWYYGDFLWQLRGFVDKLFGGVGMRRTRTNTTELYAGDSLDFWRVLYASKEEGRLLLFAEMKLPGEAWLEFKIGNGGKMLSQTATFRPKGLLGRLYWMLVYPFHQFIFVGMINKLTK
jgi:uncharacterized protein YbjT (DUF2867 family)